MKRFIPWFELFNFGPVVAIFSIFAGLVTFVFPEVRGMVLFSFWVAACITVAICLIIIFSRYFAPPDYKTPQKVLVWSDVRRNKFILPTLTDMELFLEAFIEKTVETLQEATALTPEEKAISKEQLRRMLYGVRLLFTKHPSAIAGPEWQVKEKGCAQSGKMVAVKYVTPFTSTTLYSALWHMIDSEVLQRKPDKKHENKAWWRAAETMQEKVEASVYETKIATTMRTLDE